MIARQRLTFVTDLAQIERVGQDTAHRITGTQVAALVGVTSPGAGLVYALVQSGGYLPIGLVARRVHREYLLNRLGLSRDDF